MGTGRNERCPCGSGKKYKNCCLNKKDMSSMILTKEVYEKDFLPVYNLELCEPKTFIEFEVVLPFHIPMYISKTITMGIEQGYLSFRFDMVTTNESYKYPLGKNLPVFNIHKTKMLMMVAIDLNYKEILKNKEDYYNTYFDILLSELNKLVLSYMVSSKDEDCHYLTKEMLQSTVLVRSTNLETWENELSLFLLHTHIPFEKNPLTNNEFDDFIRLQTVVLWNKNPFVMGEQHVLSAKRYFKQGFYMEAINHAQISVEVLVRTLFEELLKNDGMTDDKVKEILENTSFMAMIKKKMSAYLGGNWDVTQNNTETGRWYKNTYELRNRAIHRGRIPTFEEVDEAIHDAIEFRQYIVRRVKENKKKYPKISEFFI
ncbi:SEC-C domain-containing protein [Planococcus maritimus]|uniref:SEC-C domain-containing protein n=1 Tax=Planococcus maritimus TaxID=192421 RepID=UPI00232B408B|nr:SEC-C domain-containing protein [Planococcus maritimus]